MRWLVSLTRAVYGYAPVAWLITIPAIELGMGEGLSEAAIRGMGEALSRIQTMAGWEGVPYTKWA